MQKKLDETDTDFQQRKLAKQVEAAEASKKVTEDEQAEKEKIRDKLRTEKNLNKTAREAINRQIIS